MRIAVLCAPSSWYFDDLCRAARGDFELHAIPFSQLAVSSSSESGECFRSAAERLSSFAAIIVRTMPPGSIEQIVFRMDVLNRLQATGVSVINPPRAIEVAVDKYLATSRLISAGLCVPHTMTCQTVDEAMQGFHDLGGDVVVKPLFGSEGRGITRISDEALALRAFKMLEQMQSVIYLQEFVTHYGYDERVFVVGGKVFGMRRQNDEDWRTNVSRGAIATPMEIDAQTKAMALAASNAVGASIAGVDFLPGKNGKRYALEVNAVPGWKALSRAVEVDIARCVLEFTAEQSMGKDRESLVKKPSDFSV